MVNLRFAETPANPINEPSGWLSTFHFTKDDIMRAIELAVMGLLGMVVLLMVVRPLVRRVLAPEEARLAALPAGTVQVESKAPEASGTPVNKIAEIVRAEPSQTAKMIDIAQVQGQVHAQSVQKVGELADKNPNEAVTIIRQWLNERAAA